jgi:hypothetical protein
MGLYGGTFCCGVVVTKPPLSRKYLLQPSRPRVQVASHLLELHVLAWEFVQPWPPWHIVESQHLGKASLRLPQYFSMKVLSGQSPWPFTIPKFIWPYKLTFWSLGFGKFAKFNL